MALRGAEMGEASRIALLPGDVERVPDVGGAGAGEARMPEPVFALLHGVQTLALAVDPGAQPDGERRVGSVLYAKG